MPFVEKTMKKNPTHLKLRNIFSSNDKLGRAHTDETYCMKNVS